MKSASWLASVVSCAAVLLVLGLFVFGTKPWKLFFDHEEIVVAVDEVKQESRPVVLHISGELNPAAEVEVVSRVAGRLTEVKFKTGDTVTAGAVVASVYSGELAERVRSVEAELNTARTQLLDRERQAAEADKQFLRHQELHRQDLIARREMEQAESRAATARAQLELVRAQIAQGEAMLTQARKLQRLTRIVAPISGKVTGALSAGAPVNEARVILSIAQVGTLKLAGVVPALYAERVRDGMSAQVFPRQGTVNPRAGKVIRLDSNAKTAGADIAIEIRVNNHDRALQPGAAVDAILPLGGQELILTVPRSALHSAAGQHYVYQFADGRAVRRAVKPDDPSADPVIIRDGLKTGDRIILDRLGEVKEGVRVHPAEQAQRR